MFKDPLAIFSVEWLAQTLNVQPVILIRHPAAFVSSLKRLDWHYDFGDFERQPDLVQSYLHPFREELTEYARNPPCDVVDEGILVWRLIYNTVTQYQERHHDWLFVRHEDLSLDPVRGFERLFDYLGLQFSDEISATIADYTGSHNPMEAPPDCLHFLKRDSKANVDNWRHRLTPLEIERVHRGVSNIAQRYYVDTDW